MTQVPATSSQSPVPTLGLECLVRDVPGIEGPVRDRLGRWFVVCPRRGQVLRVVRGGCVEHAHTGGAPAGLAVGRDNCLWVADMQRGILRVSPDGTHIEPVVTIFQARPMRGCNDLAFDSQGHLYFTAPAGSSLDRPDGEVFFRSNRGEVRCLDGGYAFSNGIAVHADGTRLVVAETMRQRVCAYSLSGPGRIGERSVFAVLQNDHPVGPDGMDYDARGHLLVANWGGRAIDVFDESGRRVDRLPLPFHPSNLHFGGADRTTLFLTEHTTHGLWRLQWPTAGQVDWGLSDPDDPIDDVLEESEHGM